MVAVLVGLMTAVIVMLIVMAQVEKHSKLI